MLISYYYCALLSFIVRYICKMLQYIMSFLIKNHQTKLALLFNCPEGCQHILAKTINFNQISGIMLVNLSIDSIAGMFGLLSTFSLNSRKQIFKIYGPPGLLQYIWFLRKYSYITFRYILDICIIKSLYIYLNRSLYLYSHLTNQQEFEVLIVENEMIGRFQSFKASNFQLLAGPLYKKLKHHYRFLLPDGSIIAGKYFTDQYYQGTKIICLFNLYSYRNSVEYTGSLNQVVLSKKKF